MLSTALPCLRRISLMHSAATEHRASCAMTAMIVMSSWNSWNLVLPCIFHCQPGQSCLLPMQLDKNSCSCCSILLLGKHPGVNCQTGFFSSNQHGHCQKCKPFRYPLCQRKMRTQSSPYFYTLQCSARPGSSRPTHLVEGMVMRL